MFHKESKEMSKHIITIIQVNSGLAMLNIISKKAFTLDSGPGGLRLESNKGSRIESPRMSRREMYHYLNAYIEGYELGMREAEERTKFVKSIMIKS